MKILIEPQQTDLSGDAPLCVAPQGNQSSPRKSGVKGIIDEMVLTAEK